MADPQLNAAEPEKPSGRRLWIAIGVVVLAAGVAIFWWLRSGRESTDDAQIDGHITQVAAQVGGTVTKVNVLENQSVKKGDVLAEIDRRDYQVAVDRARAELADAEANATAAVTGVPLTEVTATTGVQNASGALQEAQGGVSGAERQVEAARAQLAAAQGRLREKEAAATKTARDVERLKGLVAKEEIPQQQFDTAVAAAEAARAAADAAKSDVAAAGASIAVAESRLHQAQGAATQAEAALRASRTGPQQVKVTQARADVARARVQQAAAALAQAELNLQRTAIVAPTDGVIGRKSIEAGQVVQPGQPLFALVSLGDVWVTANFKETQLRDVQPGQRVSIHVDALGESVNGHVDSIAGATGARFSLLPPENASGNYVKVVQRVPVKILIEAGQDPNHRLRPGMSVTPTIYTSR
jgi:membrane fusion protein (multidrug efflux system)